MFFISELACTICSTGHLRNESANFSKKHARKDKLRSFEGALYTGHNGKTLMTSEILMEQNKFFIRHTNICKTLVNDIK